MNDAYAESDKVNIVGLYFKNAGFVGDYMLRFPYDSLPSTTLFDSGTGERLILFKEFFIFLFNFGWWDVFLWHASLHVRKKLVETAVGILPKEKHFMELLECWCYVKDNTPCAFMCKMIFISSTDSLQMLPYYLLYQCV